MDKWMEDIPAELLPEQYRPLAELLGVQKLLRLADRYGGAKMYIPKVDTLIKKALHQRIREEYNGYNIKQLMRKYNLAIRSIEEICKGELPPDQMRFELQR